MKTSILIKTLGLQAALFLCLSQVTARDIYVSPAGSASGDGATMGTPVNYTRLRSILETISSGSVNDWNVYFAGGTYPVTASLSMFNNAAYDAKKVTFLGMGTPADPAIFDGNGSNNQLLNLTRGRNAAANTAFSLTIRNIVVQNFSANSGNHLFHVAGAYNTLQLDSVTITGCNNLDGVARLIYLNNDKAHLTVSHSSIIHNNRTHRLIELNRGVALIYNNTLSGNTCRDDRGVFLAAGSADCFYRLFNNTLYNTGSIYVNTSSATEVERMRFINNIVTGGSAIAGSNAANSITATNCINNIIGTAFHASDNDSPVSLPAFAADFSTTLTRSVAPGKQVHQVLNPSAASHSIFGKGSTLVDLFKHTGVALAYDQAGVQRPASGNMALGAVEKNPRYITVRDPHVYLLENRYLGISRPSSVTIDLSQSVVEASPALGALSFELVAPTALSVGTLSPLTADHKTTFTPTANLFTGSGAFTYHVKSGNAVVATGTIPVTLSLLSVPSPGYTNPSAFNTCFAYMGAVEFSSAYRYKSQLVPGNGTAAHDRMYGFSIPLVGDLDGDGYPEIVGIGANGGNTNGSYNAIHIYDGRSGERKARLYLPGCSSSSSASYTHSQYHGSPSIMALVNSDPKVDKFVEVIVAFPNSGGDPAYRGKLASFNLIPTVIRGATVTYTMTQKWGPVPYNLGGADGKAAQGAYEKPVPTVVDIDGDGVPEVVVYNNIFNARTGDLLTTLESLNHTAHVGADAGANTNDRNIGFNYVYDMDLDGVYDVVAGGKAYKLEKRGAAFAYTTIDANGIPGATVPDGRTGVADINGDGIPDVVNVTRDGARSESDIRIVVWNPGFFRMTAYTPSGTPLLSPSGEFMRNNAPQPYILADVTFKLGRNGGNGSNSYVFIGDIDGREQVVNGKAYRLPEIAVLARKYTYGSLDRHPNVVDIPAANGGISPATGGTTVSAGVIAGLTWDADPAVTDAGKKLKLSFLLEHQDNSNNTGFTMFDFDNDGKQEICYRDEQTLRIIKASRPYVDVNYTAPDVILFNETVQSFTGFEYPVIADIDNDASAEMVVMGHQDGSGQSHGYIYAVGNGGGDKFAPALPVWNQFMYDPFKIKPDLTTPTGPAVNRLDPAYTFKREIKNANNQVVETIDGYRPFNGTLTQASYSMGFETTPGATLNFEPIVFLTEAYIAGNDDPVIAKRPLIDRSGSLTYIYINVGNRASAETDISGNTPFLIYKKNKISEATVALRDTLKNLLRENTPGSYTRFGANTISPGREYRFAIPLPVGSNDPDDIYIVRLGDDSGRSATPPYTWKWRWGLNEDPDGTSGNPARGIGQARRQFRDCDWQDQWVRVAGYQTIDDAQTVQEFHSIEINIWDNDILPDAFFVKLQIPAADSMLITVPPKAGYLTFSGSGKDSRITYHHDGRAPLPNAVDSFRYKVKFWDNTRKVYREDSSTVYIYLLESAAEGFSTCYGSSMTVKLATPPGVSYSWYDRTGRNYIANGSALTLQGALTGDSIYWILPEINPDPYPVAFPKGLLTISPATGRTGNATMRWTGAVNQDWRNPHNWVELGNGAEIPARVAPSGCVDVILPTGAPHYPELTRPVSCNDITLKNRAMIAATHLLTYAHATVELKLSAAEQDRFVMWSAPLRNTYSGDYHITDGIQPVWGDVYMNLFQQANPDYSGSVAAANMFTATFGNLATPLPLGKAFNLKLTPTRANRDSAFVFPRKATQYTYADRPTHTTPTLGRTYSGRFITEEAGAATFDMPVYGGEAGRTLIQAVNPFMAYLKVSDFLAANSSIGKAYKLWSGNVNEDFIDLLYTGPAGQRLLINGVVPAGNVTLIPPLQAFFVEKANSGATVNYLKMSADWTTTKGASSYTLLRSDAQPEERNLLRIKATQGNRVSNALLCFDENASPAYRETEDSRKLFYKDIPLSVYSFTPSKEPLAINANGNYTANTGLGLRTAEEGEVRLDFSGIATFGHNVYLVDYDRNGKAVETDLRQTPYYTFTAVKQSPRDTAIELNDRFALRMEIAPTETALIPPAEATWSVSEKAGVIYIRSTEPMSNLQIYTATGALLYHTNTPSTSHEFRAPPHQTYIIKAQIGQTQKTQKIVNSE
ncbi:MAG: hypothetical protein LBQ78_07990 [Tannerellaceae bacterium]|jgi:hypothetical protein|nr:hypothetical protein [Tannerellaceae bacterium]